MKQIRIYSKNALAIALSVLVLAVATGLSYKAHYCHNHFSGIAFYTELGIQKPASCGCKEDSFIGKAKSLSASLITFKKNGCCSDISFFGKLKVETTVSYYSSLLLIQPVIDIIVFDISNEIASQKESLQPSDNEFPPPPLSGRKLVLFLSQQRIPLIIYNC